MILEDAQTEISHNCPKEIYSLTEFIDVISIINKTNKRVLYRGQSDVKWDIESSAYRELKPSTRKKLMDYHEKLLSEVDKLSDAGDHEGMLMLAHLQHNGAKTILMDYSLNPLVSLWFACISNLDEDGVVYCLPNKGLISSLEEINGNKTINELFYGIDRSVSPVIPSSGANIEDKDDKSIEKSDTNSDWTYIFRPSHLNQRIISQQSVFIINLNGKIEKEKHLQILIPHDEKKDIIDELALIGITRKTLFPDLNGLIGWFKYEDNRIEIENDYLSLVSKAEGLYRNFKYKESIDTYQEAIMIAEKLYSEEEYGEEYEEKRSEVAKVYNDLAVVFSDQGDYDKALEYYNKALKINEQVLGNHPDAATTYNHMAGVFRVQCDYDKALEYYRRALSIREKFLRQDDPDTATTYNNMAVVFSDQDEYDDALEYYGKALDIRERVLDKDHPDIATTYNNMGLVFSYQGDYVKALECYNKALEIYEKVLGDHPKTAATYNNMGLAFSYQDDYVKALECYGKALKIREKGLVWKDHPSTAAIYNNMGLVFSKQRDYDKALEYFKKDLKISIAVLGEDHPDTATTYKNIAGVFSDQKDYDKALEWYKKSYRIRLKKLGPEHIRTKEILKNIKETYKLSGKLGEDFDKWLNDPPSE